MGSADVFPGILGDLVLPILSGLTYTAFTTVHAFVEHVWPSIKRGGGPPPKMDGTEGGKFLSAQTGNKVSPADAAEFLETLESERWYWKEPPVFVSHNAFSIFWGLLSPLQFSSYIRKKYPQVHIWNGRFLLLTIIPTTITGFRLGMNSNVGKGKMVPLGLMMVTYIATQVYKGYNAIVARPRRMFEHRLRMTKLAIMLMGIPVIRLVFFAFLLPAIDKMPKMFVPEVKDGAQRLTETLGFSFISTVLATTAAAEAYGYALENKQRSGGSKDE